MARYKVKGPWFSETVVGVGPATVSTWSADLVDFHGQVFRGGAHKVLVEAPDDWYDKVVKKSRIFKGETAWSDAQRHADDIRMYLVRTKDVRLRAS